MSDPNKYTIGWIAAIRTELVAARQFLDEIHDGPIHVRQQDSNSYTLGRIGPHNIVMACLPDSDYGHTSATTVATHMLHSFPNVRVSLMVGIAGGAPTAKNDVRLGDIVVSSRAGGHGGVFQYDYGKTIQGGDFEYTQSLNQPPTLLLTAVSNLGAQFEEDGPELDLKVNKALGKKPRLRKNYARPPATRDRRYKSDFVHSAASDSSCCDNHKDGESPASAYLVTRPERDEEDDNPAVHYGLIASANQLMKDALVRDALAAEKGVLCFEMESAGLMNNLPCLVVRGICDYSDSHKNKEWQGYAAMVAAAYARDLLSQIHPSTVEAEKRIVETLNHMEQKLDTISQTTTDVKKVVDGVQSEQHIRRMEEWLQPPLPSPNVHAARQVRQEGTGTWLLAHPTFKAWKSDSRRHLWFHGQPGCGKTVLSASLLDHLMADSGRVVISFFFDFKNNKNRFVDGMLRSLAYQLYKPETVRSPVLDASFNAHENGRRQPTTDTLKDVVTKMLTQRKVSIILDALDESLKSDDLMNWLTDVTSNTDLTAVQFICTSRPEEYFRKKIPSIIGENNCICLDNLLIDVDIALFVSTQLAKRHRFQRLPQEVLEQIQRKIGEGAGGMFRWAVCQLDSLEECSTFNEVRDALENLPKDLDDTYRQILSRISSARKPGSIRLLQFLAHSFKPPSVEEAMDIIATDTDVEPACFVTGGRPFSDEDVQLYGLGLVNFSMVEDLNRTTRKEVRLAHFSVRDFLVQQHDYQLPQASIVITKMCLAYLNTVTATGTYEEIVQHHPLTSSAVELWTRFGSLAETDEATFKAIMWLLDDEKAFQLWERLYQPENPCANGPNPWPSMYFLWLCNNSGGPKGSKLYHASCFGLVRVAEKLLHRGVDINARGGYLGDALHAASLHGHGNIVKLLLQNGADINAQDGQEGSALQAAMAGGHHEVAELLLAMGADVDTPYFDRKSKKESNSLLQYALSQGYGKIAEILLKGGADIHSQGTRFGSALCAATGGKLVDKMEFFIRKGADVNATGGVYGTALQVASLQGHTEAVKLLLREGANVNVEGGKFGNALQAASHGGHLELVALLLNVGAEVNARGGYYDNALVAAAREGHVDIGKLLVGKGANIYAQSKDFGDALQAAASRTGCTELIKYLLERGANPNVEGGYGGSALQTAAFKGHVEAVELLLRNGADANAQGGWHGSALRAAIFAQDESVKCVKLLLEHGADANVKGITGNVLGDASEFGLVDIMRLLLEHGADANARGGRHGSALQAAATRGHIDCVELLLEHRAGQDTAGGSQLEDALKAAIEKHGEDGAVVRLLRQASSRSGVQV